ncbi:MAG: hypothetical protein RLZZ450_5954 [Pseudomonadota bacterium]|jgi:hypothetical protein
MTRRFGLVFAATAAIVATMPTGRGHAQVVTDHEIAGDQGDQTLIERNAQGELTTRDDSAGFGRTRQWAFSSDASIQVQRTTQSDSSGSTTTLSLAPAADYFVLPNLSVGGSVGVYYAKAGESSGSRFTVGPRVGYNFEVSRLLSVWPKLGLNYAHTGGNAPQITNVNTGTVTGNNDNNAIAISIFVPVMVHPAPHFFAGLGPFLESDLSGDNRATSWGIKLTMGGWI